MSAVYATNGRGRLRGTAGPAILPRAWVLGRLSVLGVTSQTYAPEMPNDALTTISVDDSIAALTFLADRSPPTTADESARAFKELCKYRDGGIFVGHWAGTSEWERHPVGDEIVMVMGGETTLFVWSESGEQPNRLGAGDLVVVPQGTWHRFETPLGVQVLSVTPQPTDHRTEPPS